MDQPRIELALLPPDSSYRGKIDKVAEKLGIQVVPVDAASPADLAERILIVDLSHAVSAGDLGRRVIAISEDISLNCFEVVRPSEVDLRIERAIGNLVEVERLRALVEQEQSTVGLLNEIGLSLSAITERGALLEAILTHARSALSADAGTIYLTENNELLFSAAQNDTVAFSGKTEERRLKVDDGSLAGFVAGRNTILNIDDV